jgi:hypothetical protein
VYLHQLFAGVATMLTMALMLGGHVFATVFAAILVLRRLTLLMLGMLRHGIGCRGGCRRLGSKRRRGNQGHHVQSPEFECERR